MKILNHSNKHTQIVNPLLTIGIPTYNRAKYLNELLNQLSKQIESLQYSEKDIEILIINNASVDDTERVIIEYINSNRCIRYIKNEINIGGDKNIIKCLKQALGIYVWLLGDDELLENNAVDNVLISLRNYNCDYFILASEHFQFGKEDFQKYYSLKSFTNTYSKINPNIFVQSTLISKNIINRNMFNFTFAEHKFNTSYGHMYGLMSGILRHSGAIGLIGKKIIIIRRNRADFDVTPKNLTYKLICYMLYIGIKTYEIRLIIFAVLFYLLYPYRMVISKTNFQIKKWLLRKIRWLI